MKRKDWTRELEKDNANKMQQSNKVQIIIIIIIYYYLWYNKNKNSSASVSIIIIHDKIRTVARTKRNDHYAVLSSRRINLEIQ